MTYNIAPEHSTSYHQSLMANAEMHRRMQQAQSILKSNDTTKQKDK